MMLYMNVWRFMLFLVFCIDRIFYIHSSIYMSSFDALQLSGYPPYYPRSDFWADLGLKPYFEHENGAVHLVIAQIRTCTVVQILI